MKLMSIHSINIGYIRMILLFLSVAPSSSSLISSTTDIRVFSGENLGPPPRLPPPYISPIDSNKLSVCSKIFLWEVRLVGSDGLIVWMREWMACSVSDSDDIEFPTYLESQSFSLSNSFIDEIVTIESFCISYKLYFYSSILSFDSWIFSSEIGFS